VIRADGPVADAPWAVLTVTVFTPRVAVPLAIEKLYEVVIAFKPPNTGMVQVTADPFEIPFIVAERKVAPAGIGQVTVTLVALLAPVETAAVFFTFTYT
jgi:hypothetical protein